MAERNGRRHGSEEDVPIFCRRATSTNVFEKRVTDDGGQRIGGRMACFSPRDPKSLALPIDVIEPERGDLARAETVGDQKQKNRVVPASSRRTSIDSLEHATRFVPRHSARNSREPIRPRTLDYGTEIAANVTLTMKVPKKHTERPASIAHAALSELGGPLDDKCAQDRRGQVAKPTHLDPLEI